MKDSFTRTVALKPTRGSPFFFSFFLSAHYGSVRSHQHSARRSWMQNFGFSRTHVVSHSDSVTAAGFSNQVAPLHIKSRCTLCVGPNSRFIFIVAFTWICARFHLLFNSSLLSMCASKHWLFSVYTHTHARARVRACRHARTFVVKKVFV